MKRVYEKPELDLIQMNVLENFASPDPSMGGNLEDEEF